MHQRRTARNDSRARIGTETHKTIRTNSHFGRYNSSVTKTDTSNDDPRPRHLSLRTVILIFGIAAGLRIGFVTLTNDPHPSQLTYPDEEGYWQASRSIARGEGLVDHQGFRATRMPAYPAFLSLFSSITAARVVQALLGAAAAVAIGGLGARRFGTTVGFLAGLAVAVDPFGVFFTKLLLTETLFTAALCITWCIVASWFDPTGHAGRWIGGGVLLALCIYLRPAALGLVPVLLLLVLLRHRNRQAFLDSAVVVATVAVLLLPWAWRNHRVTGEWVWGTNRMGISLWDGLGPDADGSSNLAGTADWPEVRELSEGDWNRYFRDRALQAARDDPARVIGLIPAKIARTWNPFPNAAAGRTTTLRIISAGWMLPVAGMALAGVWSLRRSGWILCLLILPAGYFTMVHTVFVGSVRYRLPAMPLLELLAAVGVVALIDAWRAAPAHAADGSTPSPVEPDQPNDAPAND